MINGAHLHLLLNHFPILGTLFALGLMLGGIFFKKDLLIRAGLVANVIFALFAIPVYLSGEEAEEVVESIVSINGNALDEHEEQGEIALWVILMGGAISLGTLLASLRSEIISRPLKWINIVIIIFAASVMIRTGLTGGKIRHSEINANVQGSGSMEHEHDDD